MPSLRVGANNAEPAFNPSQTRKAAAMLLLPLADTFVRIPDLIDLDYTKFSNRINQTGVTIFPRASIF